MERVLAVFGAVHILIDATAMFALWFVYHDGITIREEKIN